MHMVASVWETRTVNSQHDSFKTRITPKLATASRYLIYKRSTIFGHKVNRVLLNATVL